jgi:hypothetical protein
MVADHAYSPGSLPFMDRRARLFYFAAAVPAVGFMHGSADVSPLNEAMLESYPEGISRGRPSVRGRPDRLRA